MPDPAKKSPSIYRDTSVFASPSGTLFTSANEGWNGGTFNRLRVPKMEHELYAYAGHMLAIPRQGEGRLVWQADGKRGEAHIHPGMVSVQPADKFMHYCEMEGMICDTLVLNPIGMSLLLEDDLPDGAGDLCSHPTGDDWLLRFWIDELCACLPRRGEQGESMLADELLSRIGVHLIGNYGTRPRNPRNYARGLEEWRLRRVIEFMEANLSKTISLAALAKVAGGMSVYYFCRLFRQSTGVAPHTYLKKIRLNRARLLLESRQRDLLDVALETGFCDHSHLTRSFRRHFGITPSEFQRRGKSKNVQTRAAAMS